MAWWNRGEEIEELKKKISGLESWCMALGNENAKIRAILHHSGEDQPFTITYKTEYDKDSLHSETYPVLHIYRGGYCYDIPFKQWTGWKVLKEDCEIRFDGSLAYFDAVFRFDEYEPKERHFIVDYKNETYIKVKEGSCICMREEDTHEP